MANYRKLGRKTSHRNLMLRNLTTDVLKHGKITTTVTRAKETRRMAEKMITLGKKGDLNSRRGRIEGMEARIGGAQAIAGYVPLSEMFGYATTLRSITQGRANYTMIFDHYEEVPASIAAKISEKGK